MHTVANRSRVISAWHRLLLVSFLGSFGFSIGMPHAPGHAASVDQEARETFMQTEDGQGLENLLGEEADLIDLWWGRGGNVGGKLTAEEEERLLELGKDIAELERMYDVFEQDYNRKQQIGGTVTQ